MLSSSLIRYYFSRRRARQDTESIGAAEERFDRSTFSPRGVDRPQAEGFTGLRQQLSTSRRSSAAWLGSLILTIRSRFNRQAGQPRDKVFVLDFVL
jgi:hypothetical protein